MKKKLIISIIIVCIILAFSVVALPKYIGSFKKNNDLASSVGSKVRAAPAQTVGARAGECALVKGMHGNMNRDLICSRDANDQTRCPSSCSQSEPSGDCPVIDGVITCEACCCNVKDNVCPEKETVEYICCFDPDKIANSNAGTTWICDYDKCEGKTNVRMPANYCVRAGAKPSCTSGGGGFW
jgi:hypothetical protein